MSLEIQLPPGNVDPLARSTIFTDPRQRQAFYLLSDSPEPMTERDLAVQIAEQETAKSPSSLTTGDLEGIRGDLRHRCLPKLEAIGWIKRQPVGIVPTEAIAVARQNVALPWNAAHPESIWEALGALVARPRRQVIASALAGQSQPMTIRALHEAIRPIFESTDRVATRSGEHPLMGILHHVDLPKLETVGLVEYDRAAKTVRKKEALNRFLDVLHFDNE